MSSLRSFPPLMDDTLHYLAVPEALGVVVRSFTTRESSYVPTSFLKGTTMFGNLMLLVVHQSGDWGQAVCRFTLPARWPLARTHSGFPGALNPEPLIASIVVPLFGFTNFLVIL